MGQAGYTASFTYLLGQTQVVEGAGTSAALTTTYTLDGQGEPVATADGLGDTRTAAYDQDHDVTRSTDADGNIITTTYGYTGTRTSTP